MIIVELISDICTVGGGQTLVKNLSIELSKNENDKIYIISLYEKKDSPIEKDLRKHCVEIIYLSKKRGLDLKCASKLRELIKKIKPTVVHLHLNTFLTYFLSRLRNKYPIFYTFHTIVPAKSENFSFKLEYFIIKKLIKKYNMVPIAISKIVKKSIEEKYHIKNVSVVENGIDVSVFCPQVDFLNREIDFIVIGSFSEVKNQLGILKILHNLYKKGFVFNAVFLGDGKLLDKCKQFVKENDLVNAIKFTGVVSNVESYLKKSAFLLMKSIYEGNPMVINEAISSGVYIISNSVGGIPDIVNDHNGLICFDDDSFLYALENCILKKVEILRILKTNIVNNRKSVSIELTSKKYYYLFNSLGKKDL